MQVFKFISTNAHVLFKGSIFFLLRFHPVTCFAHHWPWWIFIEWMVIIFTMMSADKLIDIWIFFDIKSGCLSFTFCSFVHYSAILFKCLLNMVDLRCIMWRLLKIQLRSLMQHFFSQEKLCDCLFMNHLTFDQLATRYWLRNKEKVSTKWHEQMTNLGKKASFFSYLTPDHPPFFFFWTRIGMTSKMLLCYCIELFCAVYGWRQASHSVKQLCCCLQHKRTIQGELTWHLSITP